MLAAPPLEETAMANFVLVHGAWHGGWCYRETAQALRAAGHTVATPTHTGVGERFHQSGEHITLETHIRDVCGCIEWEELHDVILVGHSYGGMVITGVADRMAERVRSLVYLDAFVPGHGDSLNGLLTKALAPEVAAQFLGAFRGTALQGHSGLMQPIPAEMFNIAQANRARVDRLCRPQALATFEMPLLLTGAGDKIASRTYILADGWDPSPFRHFAAQAEGKPGWRVVKLPCSHDVMVDMPKELTAELLELV
jgi:pimeloyl-ACP methyl ester carboxylesterase